MECWPIWDHRLGIPLPLPEPSLKDATILPGEFDADAVLSKIISGLRDKMSGRPSIDALPDILIPCRTLIFSPLMTSKYYILCRTFARHFPCIEPCRTKCPSGNDWAPCWTSAEVCRTCPAFRENMLSPLWQLSVVSSEKGSTRKNQACPGCSSTRLAIPERLLPVLTQLDPPPAPRWQFDGLVRSTLWLSQC